VESGEDGGAECNSGCFAVPLVGRVVQGAAQEVFLGGSDYGYHDGPRPETVRRNWLPTYETAGDYGRQAKERSARYPGNYGSGGKPQWRPAGEAECREAACKHETGGG
jgi:hypothetical protein